MCWQQWGLYKLVVIAKQKRHAHFGSIQNKTQRVCQVGKKKERICRKQTKPWICFVAFPWTQVSISKCIFQTRRCFCGAEMLPGACASSGCGQPQVLGCRGCRSLPSLWGCSAVQWFCSVLARPGHHPRSARYLNALGLRPAQQAPSVHPHVWAAG